MYRISPSAKHDKFQKIEQHDWIAKFDKKWTDPSQIRWFAAEIPEKKTNFVQGTHTIAGAGDASMKNGMAIHYYLCNTSMLDESFMNSDGDLLIVPQEGELTIYTEFGIISVKPREIAVIQRGMKFSVHVTGGCRGYMAEIFAGHFVIPDLGPIGANGLANPKDFLTPVAWYEDRECDWLSIHKFQGDLYSSKMDHSPFDVVGWHGNYAPYKYNLDDFNTMNTVSYDHPDPSIFTVLTCQTLETGVAALDFVIFPPRWMVSEHTFRPPYYHKNCMSEYMGLISGQYDAKKGGKSGFVPGGGSLHNIMTGHGPETEVFEKSSEMELKPVKYPYENLAFMFETTYFINLTKYALEELPIDGDYAQHSWNAFKKTFNKDSK